MEPITIGTIACGLGIVGVMGNLVPPLGRWSSQTQNKLWSNEILDAITLSQAVDRGLITWQNFAAEMKKLGFNEDRSSIISMVYKQYTDIETLLKLYYRNEIDENEYYARMQMSGIVPEEAKLYIKAKEYYPSVQDLITFAVREVYDEKFTREFKTDEGFPERFAVEAEKQGMKREDAEKYWRAHWQLPSAQMGFEMYHREVITYEELEMLLKALDISPFWREKLTKISHNIITRVDVRRMYDLGIYNRKKVEDTYRYMGYTKQDAEDLADFVEQYYDDDLTGISRANIITAFKRELITEEQLRQFLGDIGYSEEIIEFWVSMANYEEWLDTIEDMEDDLIESYRRKLITREEVETTLDSLSAPSKYYTKIHSKLDSIDNNHQSFLSRAELIKMYYEDVITEEEFVSEMVRLRLNGNHIQYILRAKNKPEVEE